GVQTCALPISEPALGQAAHEHAERALSGHDQLVRAPDGVRIAGHHDVSADLLQRALDRSEISRARVENRDHEVSVPLVDGIAPPSRGSIRDAASHARAHALKMHSITWCALPP